MAGVTSELKGPRLEFVVREIQGKVARAVHLPPDPEKKDGKIVAKATVEEAGYLVYTPNGSVYRLNAKQLKARNFDRQPAILNFDQANDPKTAAGRFKLARNESERKKAWADMEQEVIRVGHRNGGSPEFMISGMKEGKGAENGTGAA